MNSNLVHYITEQSLSLLPPSISSTPQTGVPSSRCAALLRAAHVAHGTGQNEAALAHLDAALVRWQQDGAPFTWVEEASFLMMRCAFLLGADRAAEARDAVAHAVDICGDPSGAHMRSQAQTHLAMAEAALGHYETALDVFAAAIEGFSQLYGGAPHPDASVALLNHAVLLFRTGALKDARAEAEVARAALAGHFGAAHATTLAADRVVATILAGPIELGYPDLPELLLVAPMPVAPKAKGKAKKAVKK